MGGNPPNPPKCVICGLRQRQGEIKKERQELETKSENELLKLKMVIRNLNEEKEILKEKVSDFEVITLSDKILIDQLQDELAKLRSEKRKNEIGKLTVHNT